MKLPKWLIEWMDAQPESRAVLIEDAICERHKIKPVEVMEGLVPTKNKEIQNDQATIEIAGFDPVEINTESSERSERG